MKTKNKKTKSRQRNDGFDASTSVINMMQEMNFRVPIGETVTLQKHPGNAVPEACLGDWMIVGYNPDGSMRLRRYL